MNDNLASFDETQAEWIDIVLGNKKRTKLKEIENGMLQLYKSLGFSCPNVHIFQSYIEHKLRVSREEPGRFGASLASTLEQFSMKIAIQVASKLKVPLTKEVFVATLHIGQKNSIQLFPLLNREISRVHDSVMMQLRRRFQKTRSNFIEHGFGLANELWLCLVYHLKKLGIDEVDTLYFDLMATGTWSADFYSKRVFVSLPPSKVIRNANRRLHSITEPAIQWADGSGLYYIDGVAFDRWLWEKVVTKELPCGRIHEIINLEQRRAALTLFDFDEIIRENVGHLIDRSKRGNELYVLRKVIPNESVKLLRYKDPSTERIYTCFVPESCKKADEAMAWKFYLTEKLYAELKEES